MIITLASDHESYDDDTLARNKNKKHNSGDKNFASTTGPRCSEFISG